MRIITKPRAATVGLTRGGVPYAYASVDEASGLLTLNPDNEVVLAYLYAENPCRVQTAVAHGFSPGQTIWLRRLIG